MTSSDPLAGYRDDEGRYVRFPGKRQKQAQHEMLVALAAHFKLGRQYTEREVNDLLNEHHTFGDPATLRRLMWGKGLLQRTLDGRAYWREEQPVSP